MPVTVLPLPTFLSENVAVPPVRLTTSGAITPVSERVAMVAAAVPSYTLLLAVKLPVIVSGVMLPVVVAVVEESW